MKQQPSMYSYYVSYLGNVKSFNPGNASHPEHVFLIKPLIKHILYSMGMPYTRQQ